jgi:hypothetical protein
MTRKWTRLTALTALTVLALAPLVAWATTSLTTRISLGFTATYTVTGDLADSVSAMNLSRTIDLTSGTGASQANLIFHDSRPLADGANETLDLYASGTLLDPVGNALTMAALKALYLKNTSADATLLVGGAASVALTLFSDTTDILKIPPGGIFLWTCPSAAGLDLSTNKNLKLAHDGTGSSTLTYEIIAIGED